MQPTMLSFGKHGEIIEIVILVIMVFMMNLVPLLQIKPTIYLIKLIVTEQGMIKFN